MVSKKILKLTSRKVCAGFDLTNFVSQSRLMNFMLAKEIGFQVLSSLTLYICIRSYNLISERLLDIKCLFVAISWSELHAHPKVLTSIKLNDQVLIPCNIRIRSYNFIVIRSYELILLSTILEHIKIPIGNLKIWTPCIMICMWEYAVFSYYRYSSYFVFIHFRMFFMFPYYARFNSVRNFFSEDVDFNMYL